MTRIPDVAALADDYVLGLLDPAEEARVDARIEAEPALRRAVGAARDRFIELDLVGEAAPVAPGLWGRIVAEISHPAPTPAREATRPGADDGALAAPANDNAAARWRARALAATAASLMLAAGLGWSLLNSPQPVVVAVLLDEAGEAQVLVEDFGDASARIVPLVDLAVPEGRTMQVWTLPSPELGAVSLGLLPRSAGSVLDGPELPRPQDGQLYEITLEQPGGSPTGRPTGPILVKGFAKIPR